MTNRRFFIGFFVAALLIAGGASYYASAHPDGLEFVAEKTGFLDSAEDSPTVDSPLSDYSTKGVDNARLSGGIAGVVGCVVVLAVGGGLFWAIRRRGTSSDDDHERSRETSGV